MSNSGQKEKNLNFYFHSSSWCRKMFYEGLKGQHSNYIKTKQIVSHCVKSVQIRSFSGPYFPAFGLNTERYSSYFVRTRENTDQKKLRILVIFHAVSPSPLVSWEAVKSYYFHILWYISYDTYLISYVYTIHYIFFDRKRTFVGSYDYHRYRPWYMVYVKNLFTFFGGVSRTLQSIYDGAFLKKQATVFSCYFRKVS